MSIDTINTNITVIAHAARDQFADAVREFLAEAEVPADVRLTVNLFNGSAAFEATKWDTDRCVNCEQMLNHDELPGAATAFDQNGEFSGAYVEQHGCGAHNDPAAVLVEVTEGDDLSAALEGAIAELNAKVEAHLAALRAEWVKRGERLLEETQAELDAITDDEERADFLRGRDGNYGELIAVNWDGEQLFAEVYVPTLTENDEPEVVYA